MKEPSFDYIKGYNDGRWEMFLILTYAVHNKQYYFERSDGTIYSSISDRFLPDINFALDEWLHKMQDFK